MAIEVTADELLTFAKEAALGRKPDESSIQPMTPSRRRAFASMMRQVAKTRAKGREVDIPFGS